MSRVPPRSLLSAGCIATFFGFIIQPAGAHPTESLQSIEREVCAITAESGIAEEAPASLTIISPREGETIRSRSFQLIVAMHGNLQAARLDHLHWQLSEYENETAPDLSGIVDVLAPRDGEHSLTVYMATPEHIPINQKYRVHFKVYTQGALLLTPAPHSVVPSSDVTVNYSTYGMLPERTSVRLTLDGGESVYDLELDGTHLFQGVRDGAHTLSVSLVDENGVEFGERETREITVATTLSAKNAGRAYSLAKKSRMAHGATRLRYLKQLGRLLKEMSEGGAQSPEIPALNRANVEKALRLTTRLLRSHDGSIALRLELLLKRMKGA